MSLENQPPQATVPEPAIVRPDDLVENIYFHPSPPADETNFHDLDSRLIAGEYLIQRMVQEPEKRYRHAGYDTRLRLPWVRREPAGTKEVTRLKKVDGWAIRPAFALLASLASASCFAFDSHGIQLGENARTTAGFVAQTGKVVGHDVYRWFVPVPGRTEVVAIPGKFEIVSTNALSANQVGQYTVNKTVVASFSGNISAALAKGDKLESIIISASSSDEFGNDASIGQPSSGNTLLSDKRAAQASQALDVYFGGRLPDNAVVKISTTESVISASLKSQLEVEAKQDGFKNLFNAIEAYDDGRPMKPTLATEIKDDFASKRGVVLTAMIDMTTEVGHKTLHLKGKDNPPTSPKIHLLPFLPIPPIRRRRWTTEERPARKWQYIPGQVIKMPRMVVENLQNVWVRLRPEAMEPETGNLVASPWAYSRKYEHLMRDDRIKQVIRADYGEQDAAHTMRIMFVDHTPDEATCGLFAAALQQFCSIGDGSLAEKISGMFVYPSLNAGLDHGEPKKVGLGIDKQREELVVGECTPVLELVEIHMPTDITSPDEMVALWNSFDGPQWTLAHEAAGHGVDIKDEKIRLKHVTIKDIPNAYVIASNGWRYTMKPLAYLSKLKAVVSGRDNRPRFNISFPVTDLDGRKVTLKDVIVDSFDDRLSHATRASILGSRITQYAGEDDLEHFAETVAASLTGILVPFEEAGAKLRTHKADNQEAARFTNGYRPDIRAHNLVAKVLGAKPGVFPLSFNNQAANFRITQGSAEDDALLRQQIIRARSSTFPRPDELIAILTRVVRHRSRAK